MSEELFEVVAAAERVTALGDVQRRYFDAVSGQAGYYGTVMEGDGTAVVTVRVRVENRLGRGAS